MRRKPDDVVAILTIQGPLLTAKDVRLVVEWLQDQADFVEAEGRNLSKRFRARFLRVPHE